MPLCRVLRAVFLPLLAIASSAQAIQVSPDVARMLQSNGTLTVVVNLQGQYDLSKFPTHFATQEERVKALIAALTQFNEKSLSPIKNYLSTRDSVDVQEVTPIWITNSVRVKASADTVQALIAMNGIESIDLDAAKSVDDMDLGTATLAPTHPPTRSEMGWGVKKLGSPDLWARGVTGKGIVVAMVDTGANIKHPDLTNNIWKNPGEQGKDATGKDKATNGIDDDRNGYVDDVYGWNFESKSNDVTDEEGHGTQTAGIVAGDGTGGTQTGVAPKASLMIVRTCCSASNEVFESNTWEGLQYAIKNGARVISMSLTIKPFANPSYAKWRRLSEVILAANVVHINSAGNLGSGSEPHNIGAPATNPPAWHHPSQTAGGSSAMITIGAADENDKVREYSSTGPVTWEDVAEYKDYPYANGSKPGLIKPEVCGPDNVPSTSSDGKTYTADFAGTSAATPHIAGVAALLLSAKPNLTVAQVTELFQKSAVQVESPFNNKCGAGRVDAVAAVNLAQRTF